MRTYRHIAYQTRRAPSKAAHPDFQAGPRKPAKVLEFPKAKQRPPADEDPVSLSWWLDAQSFYVNAKLEITRMNQGRYGRLQTDWNV